MDVIRVVLRVHVFGEEGPAEDPIVVSLPLRGAPRPSEVEALSELGLQPGYRLPGELGTDSVHVLVDQPHQRVALTR